MKQRKDFQQLLEEKNLKKTSQRALIWGVLLESGGHPSVEEIRELLLAKGHRIGLATIYRTIKILLASGLLRQSKIQGMTRYEPVVGQANHLHFVCNSCGSNVEFPSRKIESLMRQVTAEHNFTETYSRYAIFGLCAACTHKEEEDAGIHEEQRNETILVRDALELTLSLERRGYTFYLNAAQRTANDGGRLMFQRLAAEESDHLRLLQAEYKSLIENNGWLKREPARLPLSRKIAEDIFPQKELHKIEVSDKTTDLEALSIAIDLERKSHQFFSDFARQIGDPAGKKIFKEFAKDEESHLKTLRTEYNALVDKQDAEI